MVQLQLHKDSILSTLMSLFIYSILEKKQKNQFLNFCLQLYIQIFSLLTSKDFILLDMMSHINEYYQN